MAERATLARVDQKLDDLKEMVNQLVAHVNTQNGRIRKLELWRAYIVGIGSAVTTIFSFVLYRMFK